MSIYRKIALLGAGIGVILVLIFVINPSTAQNPSTVIESNHNAVVQHGTWSEQATPRASGGSYLYSSGSADDVLTLAFTGTTLEIVYVAGPDTGTMVIEVDNTVLRTVVTMQEETAFYQTTVIDYLEAKAHTLKVYAAEGVIAVDAFYVTQQPAESVPESTGVVTGTVTDADSGLPLPNMHVAADFGGFTVVDCTDSNGEYTLSNLAFDTPFLMGAVIGTNFCGGPINYVQEYWPESIANPTPITLTSGDPTRTDIDFTLEIGGEIFGQVIEAGSGTPVSGMTVNVWIGDEAIGRCTAGDGMYEIHGVPFDTAVLMQAGNSFNYCGGAINYLEEFWQEALDRDSATQLTLTSGSPTLNDIDFTLEVGGLITGQVVDADSGLPLENINVDATNDASGVGACTDANGDYVLLIPFNTAYRVVAGWGQDNHCGGSVNYVEEFWEEVPSWNEATWVTLTTGNPTLPNTDFMLELGGTVSGRVTDADTGLPIENMGVSTDFNGYSFGNCTDANGDYTIYGVPFELTFTVNASWGWNFCNGPQNYVEEHWEEKLNFNEATALTLTSGSPNLTGIDFTLAVGGTLSGRVTDGDTGLPLQNIPIGVGSDEYGAGGCTDANGNFVIDSLPLNLGFRVNAGGGDNWCGGPANYVREYWEETPDWSAATIITLTSLDPDATEVDFSLGLGGTVSGQVVDADTGQPLPNMVVSVEYVGNSEGTCTDQNGNYVIHGVRLDTNFYVRAGGGNWCGGPSTYMNEFWEEVYFQHEAEIFNLTAGNANLSGIDFTLAAGGTVSGTVIDAASGLPLANMSLNVDFANAGMGFCTDSNGNFTFGPLPLNTPLRLQAGGDDNWCGGAQNYVKEYWEETGDFSEADIITLTEANRDQIGFDFTLDQGGSVAGQVVDAETSNPMPNMAVTLDLGPGIGMTGCTDENGNYLIRGVPLDTEFRARAGDLYNQCGGPTNYVREYWEETYVWDDATLLTLTSGNPTLTNIDFTLEVGGSVSGQVTGESNGQPLSDVPVRVFMANIGFLDVCPDSNGNYLIESIPFDVPFTIAAEIDSFWGGCGGSTNYVDEFWEETRFYDEATVLVVTEGTPSLVGIDFTLTLGGIINGKVTNQATGLGIPNARVEIAYDGTSEFWEIQADGGGNYTLDGLPSGNYRVLAYAPGFGREFYGSTIYFADAQLIAVTSGGTANNINIALNAGGTIAGRITVQGSGLPLEHMVVWTNGYGFACTDSNGNYLLDSLPRNVAITVGTAGGFNPCGGSELYIAAWYDGVDNEPSATQFILTNGQPNRTGIDIAVSLGGSIAGTVTAAENGQPINNVVVCAIDFNVPTLHDAGFWNCRQTLPNGTYVITGIPPTTMRVGAWKEGQRARLWYDDSTTFDDADAVSVSVGTLTPNINFALAASGSISGTVFGYDGVTPLADVTISTEDGEYFVCTKADGSYVLDVPPGTYKVMASTGDCNATVGFATQYYNGVTNVDAATPITLNSVGQTVDQINFTQKIDLTLLGPTGTIITRTPTFEWTEVGGAQWAHLKVTLTNGTTIADAWYPIGSGGAECTTGICALTHGGLGHGTGNTALQWSLQLWGPTFGTSGWFGPQAFTIMAPSMTAPSGLITNPLGNPTYQWNQLSGATWYLVYVIGPNGFTFQEWFQASAVCSSNPCSTTATTKLMATGAYQVYLQAWSPAGYSPWSNVRNFTVTASLTGGVTKTAPVSTTVTTAEVTFTWQKQANAARYGLYVSGPSFVDYRQWEASLYCGPVTCSVTLHVTSNGLYTWYVAGINTAGIGAWGSATTFTVAVADVPEITKLTPSNNANLSSGLVEFTWQHQANAVAYSLFVGGPGWTDYRQWEADPYCDPSTCRVTLLVPSNGNYNWYLAGVNGIGKVGKWSSANNASDNWGRRDFVVNAGTVTQVVPKVAPLTSQTNLVVDFEWQTVTNATSYWLYVAGPDGYIHNQQYVVGVDVTCSPTCRVTLVLPNKGSYTWYIEGISAAGGGPWGSGQAFMLNPTAPSATAILASPANNAVLGSAAPPAFEWQAVVNATWYNLVLVNPKSGAVVGSYWFAAAGLGCASGNNCHVTQALVAGEYQWTVFTWGPGSTLVHSYQHGVTPTRRFVKLS